VNDKRTKAEDKLLETLYSEIDGHYLTANKLRLEATKHTVKAALLLEKAKEFLSEDEWSNWMTTFMEHKRRL
jgi:Ni,Fe-hydrogenase III component G